MWKPAIKLINTIRGADNQVQGKYETGQQESGQRRSRVSVTIICRLVHNYYLCTLNLAPLL